MHQTSQNTILAGIFDFTPQNLFTFNRSDFFFLSDQTLILPATATVKYNFLKNKESL